MRISATILNSYLYCKSINDFTELKNRINKVKSEVSKEAQQGLDVESEVYDYLDRLKSLESLREPSKLIVEALKKFNKLEDLTFQVKCRTQEDDIDYYAVADIINPNVCIIDLKTTKHDNSSKDLYKNSVQHLIYSRLWKLNVFYYVVWSSLTNKVTLEKYIITEDDQKRLDSVISEFDNWLISNNLKDTYLQNFKSYYSNNKR